MFSSGCSVSGMMILAKRRPPGAAMKEAAMRYSSFTPIWRIADEDGAGDGGEAADHDGEEFGTGHPRDVGADDERGFGLADEDIGGGGEGFGPAGAEGFAEAAAEGADDDLHGADVVEDGDEGGEEDDHGEDFDHEDEAEAGAARVREATEEEGDAFVGAVDDHLNADGEPLEGGASPR